ncbi:hypothetical protein TNCT_739121 [Trichonephila clavata]|uniref:Uncharacterized protein n=1 Tax=Trichonephila clavata TaxID=2740835 RepID=A0A8X6J6B3_TRICU|nr:hypothetical protein TNCT_695991 [Trichonephila clavata]GFR13258.1 hypothetical protein TNCT_739121 [Trichonephila clavata]
MHLNSSLYESRYPLIYFIRTNLKSRQNPRLMEDDELLHRYASKQLERDTIRKNKNHRKGVMNCIGRLVVLCLPPIYHLGCVNTV